MLKKLTDLSIKYRWLVIILFLGVSILFGTKLKELEIDTDIKSMLPNSMPAKIRLDKIEEMFGGTEIVMIALDTDTILNMETLKRIKKLSKEFKKIDGVDRVMSLSETDDIRAKDGELQITGFLRRVPKDEKAMNSLKNYIMDNESVYGSIVSKDFSATAIVLIMEANIRDEDIINGVKKVLEQVPGDERVHIAGLPYIRTLTSNYMKSDMRRFMPIGFAIMLVFLYLCFKEFKGVFLPFLAVVLSVLVAMGSIYFFNWKVQLPTILLPIILIAIANDYGIHLISEYQMIIRKEPDLDKSKVIKKVMKTLSGPVIVSGITTIIGMLCLQSHLIVPAKQLGVLAAIGISFALAASLILIPAILSFLPKSKLKTKDKNKASVTEKLLENVGKYLTVYAKKILLITVIALVIIAAGITKIVIDTNPINYFNKNSPVVKSDSLINDKFGGSTTISIVASGDMKDVETIQKIANLDKALEKRPTSGAVSSISDILRKMNKSLNNNDESFDRVPETSNAIAEYYLLYSMTGDPEDLEKLIDFNYENVLITERISSASAKTITNELQAVNDEIGKYDNSPFTIIGGFGDILAELVKATVNGQLISLFTSLLVVAIVVALFFRSAVAGILCSVPIAFALVILFGLMGYLGIELNIITALLTSIMIGVGVDYSIHFLWRFKKLKEQAYDNNEAVSKSLTSIGRGIIFNALSVVIGFTALTVSNFMPIRFFGLLIIISISACLFAALFILPALCVIFEPFSKNRV